MRVKILLSSALMAGALCAAAQSDTRAYTIVGKPGNTNFWSDIKQVDLATGKTVKSLFDAGVTTYKSAGAGLSKMNGIAVNADPMAYGVAACALDSRSNRLYFTPLHFAQLRYIDLSSKSPEFVYLDLEMVATPKPPGLLSEENHITRMVIAADGYGYAVSNDGNHFIRFSTGKNPVATDLGNLVDADAAKVSVHNKCTSWGGDMIADAFGKLYVISANRHVFKIDADTRIATHLGAIEGLPAGFTTNGAAVDADGKIVVASANSLSGYYRFDINTLKATLIEGSDNVYSTSDLANGNFLLQKEADKAAAEGRPVLTDTRRIISNGLIAVYPNPVIGSQFRVSFANNQPGTYTIALTDLLGRVLQSKVVNIQSAGQVETVSLKRKPAQGMYMVKVISNDSKAVFSEKIMID